MKTCVFNTTNTTTSSNMARFFTVGFLGSYAVCPACVLLSLYHRGNQEIVPFWILAIAVEKEVNPMTAL